MQGTGQLPKFAEDAYRTDPDDLFLIPTAEVPVTNLLRDEVVDGATLPRGYVAYTPCFRREAGAAGKDTRGLLRVHQFDKVELVRFSRAAESAVEHERLTGHAEEVLRRLALPYRVVLLAAGDLGFASAKTYDLEVWAPGVGAWLECSSSSTFTDFQARRANIRCRPQPGGKVEFVHTLNASGVALPRTIAALLEPHRQPDRSAGHVSAMANAPLAPNADSVTLRRWITQLDAVNTPMVQPGVGTIHYGPLPAARRFTVLAVLEGAVFLCLALLAVWAYRSQVAAARDRLWVAMARESAHQLGTPLMSLTGWIAYLRENPGTPVGELADHLEADAERLERVAKRFERIGRPARREPVGLGVLAERVVSYFRPRMPTLASPVTLALVATRPGPTALGHPVPVEWAPEAGSKRPGTPMSLPPNPQQQAAVRHPGGPLLVLAGAGSGKTRVLTARIAYLIQERGVAPQKIFAVTFTNRAAGEMRSRVAALLGADPKGLWIGTFHSLSARLLRREAAHLGFGPNFTIYDQDDSESFIKRLLEQRGLSPKANPPRAIHAVISSAKNRMLLAEELGAQAESPLERVAAEIYAQLGPALRQANAMDFDDLPLHAGDPRRRQRGDRGKCAAARQDAVHRDARWRARHAADGGRRARRGGVARSGAGTARRRGGCSLRRHGDPVPHQRAVPPAGGGVPVPGDPLPAGGGRELLRAPRGEGRPRLSAVDREPCGRRGVRAGGQRPAARDR